jgi:hypothetical protein
MGKKKLFIADVSNDSPARWPHLPRHGGRFAARAPPSPVAMNVELILKTGGWHGLTIKWWYLNVFMICIDKQKWCLPSGQFTKRYGDPWAVPFRKIICNHRGLIHWRVTNTKVDIIPNRIDIGKCYRMSYRCVSNCATLGISHFQTHTHTRAQTNHFLWGRDLTGEVPMNPKVSFFISLRYLFWV